MKKLFFSLFWIAVIILEAFIFQRNGKLNNFQKENDFLESPSARQSAAEDDFGSLLSPDGKILAIPDGNTLILKDMMTNTQKEIPIAELSIAPEANGLFLEGWSDSSDALWGIVFFSESPNFFRIVAPNWQVEHYAFPHLPWGRDYALNPNSGLLAFSTYPFFFDTEELEEFEKSQQRVTLSVSDLFSGKLQLVAEATAKSFQPKWIERNILEYTNPTTESQIHFTFQ